MNIGNKLLVIAILFGLLFSFGVNETFAHCGKCGMGEKEEIEAVTKASPVTFKAEVICLGCSLKKEQGAKALCSIYGHANALRTEDGKIWTILENDVSTELINSHDYAGKEVEIIGKKFANSSVIEVESFKVIEE